MTSKNSLEMPPWVKTVRHKLCKGQLCPFYPYSHSQQDKIKRSRAKEWALTRGMTLSLNRSTNFIA